MGEFIEVLIWVSAVWKTSLGRRPLVKYLPKMISCYFSIQQTFMAALKDFDLKAVVGKGRPTNPDSFSRVRIWWTTGGRRPVVSEPSWTTPLVRGHLPFQSVSWLLPALAGHYAISL